MPTRCEVAGKPNFKRLNERSASQDSEQRVVRVAERLESSEQRKSVNQSHKFEQSNRNDVEAGKLPVQ